MAWLVVQGGIAGDQPGLQPVGLSMSRLQVQLLDPGFRFGL